MAKNWTKDSFSFLKFIIFVDLERKNEFHGNIAIYRLYLMRYLNENQAYHWKQFSPILKYKDLVAHSHRLWKQGCQWKCTIKHFEIAFLF